MDEFAAGEVGRLLSELTAELGRVGDVSRQPLVEHDLVAVDVTPSNPDALPLSWIEGPTEIVFQPLGHGSARWELPRTVTHVALMRDLARSIVAGRAEETFVPWRSRLKVVLADGTAETAEASGLLPTRRWERKAKTVVYSPWSGG